MARLDSHDDLADLLGAYALDALEPDEVELLERHLETCPRCRAELAGHREVTGLLGFAGQEAPAGVWERIVSSMQEPPPALRLQRVDAATLDTIAALPTVEAEADPSDPNAPKLQAYGPDRPAATAFRPAGWRIGSGDRAPSRGRAERGRRRLSARVISTVAAAAVVAAAVLAVQVVRLDGKKTTTSPQVATVAAGPTMSSVHAALAMPGSRKVVLTSLSGKAPALDAVIMPDGQGYLYDSHLSPLGDAHTYQLWGIEGATRVSYGVLGATIGQVEAFRAVADAKALAVTAEVAGGVVQSTQDPVAIGSVPA
jgi:hypothetical protein